MRTRAGTAQYGHDKAGFRNLKIEGGRETRYHYEPSGLLLLCDHLGTPVALATTDCHIVQTIQYDCFGNLLQVRAMWCACPSASRAGSLTPTPA